jgi:hypothetical protein
MLFNTACQDTYKRLLAESTFYNEDMPTDHAFNDKPEDNKDRLDAGLKILATMIARRIIANTETSNRQTKGQTPSPSSNHP